ncbi:MAG: DNA polymerase III subunit delta [Firmicutes bacterium]|nr:DNA polymerase III subunit delta [Bacillota bacterium]MCL1953637.1 DNA polymerase III subunit delta [Bacillota bacterium]
MSTIKFLELNKLIKNKSLSPCYNIIGDDKYLIGQAISMFVKLVQLHDFNKSILSNPTIEELIDNCNCLPIGSEYRLVIVNDILIKTKVTAKNVSQNDKLLLQYLSNPNLSTILLFVNSQFNTIVKDKIQTIDCSKLDEKTLNAWIIRECNKYNCSIDENAISLFIKYCNNDLQRIRLEVDKLCAYKFRENIELQDIIDLIHPDISYTIFQLSEAVAKKNAKLALQILKFCMQSGEEPVSLLGLLYSHFRRMLLVSLNQNNPNLAQLLGIKDYPLQILKTQCKEYKVAQIRNILSIFWHIDQAFRNGKMPLEWAVEYLITQICHSTI